VIFRIFDLSIWVNFSYFCESIFFNQISKFWLNKIVLKYPKVGLTIEIRMHYAFVDLFVKYRYLAQKSTISFKNSIKCYKLCSQKTKTTKILSMTQSTNLKLTKLKNFTKKLKHFMLPKSGRGSKKRSRRKKQNWPSSCRGQLHLNCGLLVV